MESQPQNPEFTINSENFNPCICCVYSFAPICPTYKCQTSDFILPILQPNTGCFPIEKRLVFHANQIFMCLDPHLN